MRKPTREELLTDALIAMRDLAFALLDGDNPEDAGLDIPSTFTEAELALATDPS